MTVADDGIEPGARVRFTTNSLGLLEHPSDSRFQPEHADEGDEGTYRGPHPTLGRWHLVDVEVDGRKLIAPVGLEHFELVEGADSPV